MENTNKDRDVFCANIRNTIKGENWPCASTTMLAEICVQQCMKLNYTPEPTMIKVWAVPLGQYDNKNHIPCF